MEVQELIFAVHPGMTDHLRTNNFRKMYFYSRINFINDFFSIVYCYIVYFLLVLDRKSKFTIFCIYFA